MRERTCERERGGLKRELGGLIEVVCGCFFWKEKDRLMVKRGSVCYQTRCTLPRVMRMN
jgi:hypothetical protein